MSAIFQLCLQPAACALSASGEGKFLFAHPGAQTGHKAPETEPRPLPSLPGLPPAPSQTPIQTFWGCKSEECPLPLPPSSDKELPAQLFLPTTQGSFIRQNPPIHVQLPPQTSTKLPLTPHSNRLGSPRPLYYGGKCLKTVAKCPPSVPVLPSCCSASPSCLSHSGHHISFPCSSCH